MPAFSPIAIREATSLRSIWGLDKLFAYSRQDRWIDYFRLDADFIEPLTDVGSATVRLLRLNAVERLAERRLLMLLRHPAP